jgi:TPR repeat protein
MTDGSLPEDSGKGLHYYALTVGSKLFEFEIESVLGHGGFGITYLARDTHLQELVAIKEYLPNDFAVRVSDATVRAKSEGDRAGFQAGLKAFLEEARLLARFRHRNIVHVRRFFELHGTGYIVLDFEHGQTLGECMNAKSLSESDLLDIMDGVMAGLEAAHARAILHRDLKPSNVILREDGSPVLIDFGAARDFQDRHSRSVTAIVTAGYSPPEQYGAGGQQGPWTDIYALGAIAYRAVSGVPPIDSLRRLRRDPLVPAVEVAKGKYGSSLLQTIDWMLRTDEAERPSSVEQVRAALKEQLPESIEVRKSETQAGSHAQPGVIAGAGTSTGRRRRRWGIAAGVLMASIVAVLAYGIYTAAEHTRIQNQERLRLAEMDRLQQLSAKLSEAKYDRGGLQDILARCGESCPDQLRNEAQSRISAIVTEENAYTAAEGDSAKLKIYLRDCKACLLASQARAQVSRIEEQQTRRQEEQQTRRQEESRRENEKRAARDDCDRLAASPGDRNLPPGVAGVQFKAIELAPATAACKRAHEFYPDEPRFSYQLGRVFHAAHNYEAALPLYRSAASLGNSYAMTNLGAMYTDGSGVEKSYADAARYFRQASDGENDIAMLNLGVMYSKGMGMPKDAAEAARLFRRAGDLGNTEAMFNLAVQYQSGSGVPKDEFQSARLFRAAADLGNSNAVVGLGFSYQNGLGVAKDFGEAARLYRRSAEQGNITAVFNLGVLYQNGWGVPQSFAEAEHRYRQAADQDSPDALTSLGALYQNGQGVPKDLVEAAKLYQKAVELGNSYAMANLSSMYLNGLGVVKNAAEAVRLARKAVEANNVVALNNLGIMYQNGLGVSKDDEEAVRLFRRSADLNGVDGMTNLAICYANGRGVRRDDRQAVRLLRKAIDLGGENARKTMQVMIAQGRVK